MHLGTTLLDVGVADTVHRDAADVPASGSSLLQWIHLTSRGCTSLDGADSWMGMNTDFVPGLVDAAAQRGILADRSGQDMHSLHTRALPFRMQEHIACGACQACLRAAAARPFNGRTLDHRFMAAVCWIRDTSVCPYTETYGGRHYVSLEASLWLHRNC